MAVTNFKHLQDNITDFKKLIQKLCDPYTGAYKNVAVYKVKMNKKTGKNENVTVRYNQKVDCLLRDRDDCKLTPNAL